MKIQWQGHACFQIHGAGVCIVTDPYTPEVAGLSPIRDPADVVIMYLETDSNEKLRPTLEKSLRAGARVVSHEYKVPGWKATRVAKADPGYGHTHTIYLYRMPPEKQ